MPVRRGTYILVVRLDSPRDLRVGALGDIRFDAGTYIYAGSAMGGLDQRLSRHLSREKTIRWHIDYLTTACDDQGAFESYPDPVPECDLARIAEEEGAVPAVSGFGCSDCGCLTHLFRASDDIIQRIVARAGLRPYKLPRASL